MASYSNQAPTTQSVYSLPVLNRSEIASILAEYQIINLSDSDLTNPTPNFVFNLYTSLLCHLDSLQDDPSQVAFGALERFENPDMHADAIRAVNLYRKIKDVLLAIECPLNFTLADLIRPEPNRTLKFLSAIINFFLHKDSKLSLLRPYAEELGALEDERKLRESKILQLKEEITAFNEAREREKPQVLEAEAKVKELQQTLDNLNSLQLNMKKERQAMKEKAQEMENNVRTAEFELIQASEENAILRSKIVSSPDKLQRDLEEKRAALNSAKDAERTAFQTYQEKTTVLEKMTKQLAQMQAIQEQVNSSKTVEKDVKLLKAKLSDEQMQEKTLEAKEIECEAKAKQLDEQLNLLEKEAKLRHEQDTKILNNVKLEEERWKHDLEIRRQKIEALLAEVHAIEAKRKSMNDLASATQEELLKKGEEVVKEVKLYMNSTAQEMSNMEKLQLV